ncbi:MAG: hypothetical protein LBU04_00480 [Christensenellaceae bacterium]|nr:hypothetical protein [Christensenellaceae bacterium]
MISVIILIVLGFFTVLGFGKSILKEFRVGIPLAATFLAFVVGLSFVPQFHIGAFSFTLGFAIFYLNFFSLILLFGRLSIRIATFLLVLILSGIVYSAMQLFQYFDGNIFFRTPNLVYAILVGFVACVISLNGKYALIISIFTMLVSNLLSQIGSPAISLDVGFDLTIVSFFTAASVYTLIDNLAKRSKKFKYYCEIYAFLDTKFDG